ncbi:MAG: type II toxin-antitoxin system RelB/DinJ family antitoxin [Eggerthellaceae bacterium]|nr:type II toxin-antitoxin system RelB/DinJ family antitoxin [Eggerthellaceae bacterium]
MEDAMVSARMSGAKKEAGNRVLESLGTNASRAINEFYDFLIANKTLPWKTQEERPPLTREQIQEGLAWIRSLQVDIDSRFARMTDDEIKSERLRKHWPKEESA